ncbi:MAG: DUF3006 domain-containing protein [bacterium]|nr:DUF3006 domain-containing protein [bacterium]
MKDIWKKKTSVEGIVDRVENGIAVIQMFKGGEIELPIRNLPNGTKEGNVLKITFTIDRSAETLRRNKIKEMQKRLSS